MLARARAPSCLSRAGTRNDAGGRRFACREAVIPRDSEPRPDMRVQGQHPPSEGGGGPSEESRRSAEEARLESLSDECPFKLGPPRLGACARQDVRGWPVGGVRCPRPGPSEGGRALLGSHAIYAPAHGSTPGPAQRADEHVPAAHARTARAFARAVTAGCVRVVRIASEPIPSRFWVDFGSIPSRFRVDSVGIRGRHGARRRARGQGTCAPGPGACMRRAESDGRPTAAWAESSLRAVRAARSRPLPPAVRPLMARFFRLPGPPLDAHPALLFTFCQPESRCMRVSTEYVCAAVHARYVAENICRLKRHRCIKGIHVSKDCIGE
jgi:hypothetical protein